MHIHGWPLALAVFFAAIAGFAWVHRWKARAVSFGAAGTALVLIAAVPAWTDALAGVFANGPGMVVLTAGAFLGTGTFIIHHIRPEKHHAVWTSVTGVVAATCGGMAWAMAPELGRRGAMLGPRTAEAMGQAVTQIRTGHAAAAETPAQRFMILAVVALVIIGVTALAHKRHKRQPFPPPRPLPLTPARRALTAARRHSASRDTIAIPPGRKGA